MRVEDYMKKIRSKNTEPKENSYRVSIIRRTLITTTIILALLITCNLSNPAKRFIDKYIFKTHYNFSKINNMYKKYLLNLTKNPKNDNVTAVNGNSYLEYSSSKEYKNGVELEVSENYNVKMLESGLVVFIGEKEDYGFSVVVQQSNGIDVTYGGITNNNIKIYDYVEKGTIIGTANKRLYLEFTKDGEKLDYKTYIK